MYFILWNNWWLFKRKIGEDGCETVVFSIGDQAFNKTIPVIILENFIWLNPHSNDKQGMRAIVKGTKDGRTRIWMSSPMVPERDPLCCRLAPSPLLARKLSIEWCSVSYILLTKFASAISIGCGIYHVLSSALCTMVTPTKQMPFFFKWIKWLLCIVRISVQVSWVLRHLDEG